MQRCCWRFAAPVRPVELHLHPTFSSSQVENVYSEAAQTDDFLWVCSFPTVAILLTICCEGLCGNGSLLRLIFQVFLRAVGRSQGQVSLLSVTTFTFVTRIFIIVCFYVLILSIPCNLTAALLPLTTDEAAPGWVRRCINCRLSSVFFFFVTWSNWFTNIHLFCVVYF